MHRTPLERKIEHSESLGAIVHRRRRYFSVDYGVWLKHEDLGSTGPIELSVSTPEGSWIKESLASMVREEGGREFDGETFREAPATTAMVADEAMDDYLEKCEELIFGPRTEAVIRNNSLDAEAKIQKLLADPQLGNTANAKNLTTAEIGQACELNAQEKAPLTFILPAFPFKEQNEFRSSLPANTPDFGEIGLLCRMHALAMAVNQIYHNDVRWLIVTDGTAYEKIFRAPEGCAREYIGHLRAIRNRLNLQSTIHFVDLMDLVAKYESLAARQGLPSFRDVVGHITRVLKENRDAEIDRDLHELAEGMKWNTCWTHISAEKEVLWKVLRAPLRKGTETAVEQAAYESALETAINYSSFNLAMRWTNLIRQFFPWGLRATSHPKRGQVAIPRIGSVSPWNGVSQAILDAQGRPEIVSKPLYQLGDGDWSSLLRIGAIPAGVGSREFVQRYGV